MTRVSTDSARRWLAAPGRTLLGVDDLEDSVRLALLDLLDARTHLAAVRAAAGIPDDADPVEAIAELRARADDTPPPVDAALLAAANRALAAEVDELRAELAAERGDVAGALPGWEWRLSFGAWCHRASGCALIVSRHGDPDDGWRADLRGNMVARGPTARAAMRAAESAARDLGLLADGGGA